MKKRCVFHYDKTKPAWKKETTDMLIVHDGMECSVDIEDFGMLDIVSALFDDGIELNAYVCELEEVNENIECDYCTNISPAMDCVLPNGTERLLVTYPDNTFLGRPFVYERQIKFCPMCGREINHIKE